MSLSKTLPDSSREKKFLSTNWNFCGFNFNDFGILVAGGERNIGRFWDWCFGAIKLIVEIRLPFIFIRDITLPALQITTSELRKINILSCVLCSQSQSWGD